MLKKRTYLWELSLIKKILVAVDGSENSVKALDFALEMCEKYTATLTIVNVSEQPAIASTTTISHAIGVIPQDITTMSPQNMLLYSKEIEKTHQEILKKALEHAQKVKPNIPISTKLRIGEASSEIVTEAKESKSDVIVMGHKGIGKVKEILGLGGSSEKVAHLAHCPVIIVR